MELDTIIKSLKVICGQNEMKDASSDMILDCAMRLHISNRISAERAGRSSEGATEKQKDTLKKFSIEFKDDITKKDASKLISDKINSFS